MSPVTECILAAFLGSALVLLGFIAERLRTIQQLAELTARQAAPRRIADEAFKEEVRARLGHAMVKLQMLQLDHQVLAAKDEQRFD